MIELTAFILEVIMRGVWFWIWMTAKLAAKITLLIGIALILLMVLMSKGRTREALVNVANSLTGKKAKRTTKRRARRVVAETAEVYISSPMIGGKIWGVPHAQPTGGYQQANIPDAPMPIIGNKTWGVPKI